MNSNLDQSEQTQVVEPAIETPTENHILQQENQRLRQEINYLKHTQEPCDWKETFIKMKDNREHMEGETKRLKQLVNNLEKEIDNYYNLCLKLNLYDNFSTEVNGSQERIYGRI
jgi:hypothetical protein